MPTEIPCILLTTGSTQPRRCKWIIPPMMSDRIRILWNCKCTAMLWSCCVKLDLIATHSGMLMYWGFPCLCGSYRPCCNEPVGAAHGISLGSLKGQALIFPWIPAPWVPHGKWLCSHTDFCATTRYWSSLFRVLLIILRLSTPLEHQNISIQLLMPPPVDPVTSPVTFPFENGAIRLITVIDPVSGWHSVVCDLCDQSISLGIQAASKPLFNHLCMSSHGTHF